ncbi:MAG: hypothetical protein KME32_20685 [Mojavia pulchra JT2-VF2]|jgi:hypothetical protein|uniref:Uncharacterized protein n=1 Tax=Mojavia pulchra JT2-VF2 TaxID=287848 RepID=A0A951Q1F5_9NOST|nr:hypothetical protein [Mojavia pulchra JT2-VF2]
MTEMSSFVDLITRIIATISVFLLVCLRLLIVSRLTQLAIVVSEIAIVVSKTAIIASEMAIVVSKTAIIASEIAIVV